MAPGGLSVVINARISNLRPHVDSRWLAVAATLWLFAACNQTFWHKAAAAFAATPLALLALGATVVAIYLVVLLLLLQKYLAKPVLLFLLAAAGGASYFTDTFGTVIDVAMIDSAMTTTGHEAGQLFTSQFFLHMALFIGLPAAVVLWIRIDYAPWRRRLVSTVVLALIAVAVGGALFYSQFGIIVFALRQDRLVMKTLNPAIPIASAYTYATRSLRQTNIVVAPLGTDARLGPAATASSRPFVTVVVVGETARAMNFSLNGYARKTNPQLEKLDIVNFPDVSSCGTATAVSVPCMFSKFGHADYSDDKAKATENVLDVLHHAGVDVLWWDNNTGPKGVTARLDSKVYNDTKDPVACATGVCLDDVFLPDLDKLLDGVTRDTVLVLHQTGSHGPAYYLGYPKELRVFTPDCATEQVTTCSQQEVLNSYDNTILTTDRFLARVIDSLSRHDDRVAGAMYYVSDHGESLGEHGMYLHGAPYALAPETQTHVPMVTWFSPAYAEARGLDVACVRARAGERYSHDNLFDTLLGMMDVTTDAYRADRDILSPCLGRS